MSLWRGLARVTEVHLVVRSGHLEIVGGQVFVVRAVLRTIRETEGMHQNDTFKIDARLGMEVFMSEDANEGPRAFEEKWNRIFTVTENPVT